jgi:hypothetical protein
MSSVGSSTYTGTNDKKTYISTADFRYELYDYTVTLNTTTFNNIGVLTHSDSIGNKCPAGRILHENGKKLHPEVNVMTTFPGAGPVTSPKFLVGVYDPISFLNGYIDPTSNTFALYDTNYAVGQIDGRRNGIIYSSDGQGAKLNVAPVSPYVLFTTNGQTVQGGSNCIGSVALQNNTSLTVDILTTAYITNSLVFLSCANVTGGSSPGLSYLPISGGFRIILSANPGTVAVNWMIVN